MNVLVTGASGFVGSALVRTLADAGHRVTAITRRPAAIAHASAVIAHDFKQGSGLEFPSDIDAVAHLAQARAYRQFPGDFDEMFRVNVGGTQATLMAAARAGVRCFCLISSGSVYEPFDRGLAEEAALAPTGALGATKLAAEVIAQPFQAQFALSVLRLFTPYGPGQTERLVPDLVRRVRTTVPVTLPLQGGGMRTTPTHVDDICLIITEALAKQWCGILNVASPQSFDIQEMATAIATRMGVRANFERRANPAPIVVPDLVKLGQMFDVGRLRSFADGIESML